MRESRIATLNTRREHERLTRAHGTIARQALQDPLTGLPNRRALDERMAELHRRPDAPAGDRAGRPRRVQGRQRPASRTPRATTCFG